MLPRLIGSLFVAATCLLLVSRAEAQGLIWNLPADGTEVVYGGTMTQTETSPEGEESVMTWDRQLVIRSVGAQEATVGEEQVPARWIEFELRTGQRTEQGINTGPVGTRIYRVLVPESAITGKPADERGIPNSFLPIVEGYEKIGEQQPRKLESGAFEVYPVLAQIMNYKPDELKAAGEEPADVPAGQYTATKYTGTATIESRSTRAENQANLWVSPDMPFGVVRWQATTTRSRKDPNQPRDAFVATTKVETTMEARAINENARGVLAVP